MSASPCIVTTCKLVSNPDWKEQYPGTWRMPAVQLQWWHAMDHADAVNSVKWKGQYVINIISSPVQRRRCSRNCSPGIMMLDRAWHRTHLSHVYHQLRAAGCCHTFKCRLTQQRWNYQINKQTKMCFCHFFQIIMKPHAFSILFPVKVEQALKVSRFAP